MPSDTDYLSAVQQGDTKTAQQMVDEAAKAAGAINNARPLYHGGNKAKTSFARGASRSGMGLAYLTDKKQVAWKYALGGGINSEMSLADYRRKQLEKLPSREPTVQKLYVIGDVADFSTYRERPHAPQLIEMFGEKRMSRILEDYSSQSREEIDRGESVENTLQNALDEGAFVQEDTDATAKVPELQFLAWSGLLDSYLKKIGKNVIAYNDAEAGGKTYVVFDPTQIKSADPITRDDAGNVIPLSQRFKATSDDIRYMPGGIDESTGLPLNKDGTVTVYHHTNKKSSQSIKSTGVLKSAGEPDVYVTTETNPVTGYGSDVVKINVDPARLQIDDEFPDGRKDFRLSVGKPGGSIRVNVIQDPRFMPQPDSSMPGAYTFTGGYRALPGKAKGSLRLYGPAGSLLGIVNSLEEAQRIIKRKSSN